MKFESTYTHLLDKKNQNAKPTEKQKSLALRRIEAATRRQFKEQTQFI